LSFPTPFYAFQVLKNFVIGPNIGIKIKAAPVTGLGGLSGCKILRIPHCLDNRLTDGGKVVSPTYRPLLSSPETLFVCLWYSFLLETE
jgi:hypothetical protein